MATRCQPSRLRIPLSHPIVKRHPECLGLAHGRRRRAPDMGRRLDHTALGFLRGPLAGHPCPFWLLRGTCGGISAALTPQGGVNLLKVPALSGLDPLVHGGSGGGGWRPIDPAPDAPLLC